MRTVASDTRSTTSSLFSGPGWVSLAEARGNGTLYERVVGGSTASLPRTEPGTGIYDYREGHRRSAPRKSGSL
jgi:hypothetical protein